MKLLITLLALLLVVLVGCALWILRDASGEFLTVSFFVVCFLFAAGWKITKKLEEVFV